MSQFAQIADLFRYGMAPTARGVLTDDQLNGALVSATGTMVGFFAGRYNMPLLAWGEEVIKYCCWIAAFEVLSGGRGYNPAAGADPLLLQRYNLAIQWCRGVQSKAIHPIVTPSAAQSPTYDQPLVISSSVIDQNGRTASNRGW